jgi:hypothetical protein
MLSVTNWKFKRLYIYKKIANELLDAFTDTKRVTKSHIPVLNAPSRIDITPIEVTIQRKRGRPIGSKDKKSTKQERVE